MNGGNNFPFHLKSEPTKNRDPTLQLNQLAASMPSSINCGLSQVDIKTSSSLFGETPIHAQSVVGKRFNALEMNKQRQKATNNLDLQFPLQSCGQSPNHNSNYRCYIEPNLSTNTSPNMNDPTQEMCTNESISKIQKRSSRKGNKMAKRRHEADLKKAIVLVVMNDYSLRQAASTTKVSHETLRRRLMSLKLRTNKHNSSLTNSHHASYKEPATTEPSRTFEINRQIQNVESNPAQSSCMNSYNGAQPLEALNSDVSVNFANVNRPDSAEPTPESIGSNRQISKLMASIESFERFIAKDFICQTPELHQNLHQEFSRVKSKIVGYINHTVEALQTASMMVLEEIEQNEPHKNNNRSEIEPNSNNTRDIKDTRDSAEKAQISLKEKIDKIPFYSNVSQAPASMPQFLNDPNQPRFVPTPTPISVVKYQAEKHGKAGSIYNLIHNEQSDQDSMPMVNTSRLPQMNLQSTTANNVRNIENDRSTMIGMLPQLREESRSENAPKSLASLAVIRGSHVPIMALLSEDD